MWRVTRLPRHTCVYECLRASASRGWWSRQGPCEGASGDTTPSQEPRVTCQAPKREPSRQADGYLTALRLCGSSQRVAPSSASRGAALQPAAGAPCPTPRQRRCRRPSAQTRHTMAAPVPSPRARTSGRSTTRWVAVRRRLATCPAFLLTCVAPGLVMRRATRTRTQQRWRAEALTFALRRVLHARI